MKEPTRSIIIGIVQNSLILFCFSIVYFAFMVLTFEGFRYPWLMGILGILSVFIILCLPAINMRKKKYFLVIGNLLALVVYPIAAGFLLFLAAMILGIHH